MRAGSGSAASGLSEAVAVPFQIQWPLGPRTVRQRTRRSAARRDVRTPMIVLCAIALVMAVHPIAGMTGTKEFSSGTLLYLFDRFCFADGTAEWDVMIKMPEEDTPRAYTYVFASLMCIHGVCHMRIHTRQKKTNVFTLALNRTNKSTHPSKQVRARAHTHTHTHADTHTHTHTHTHTRTHTNTHTHTYTHAHTLTCITHAHV